jgi:hypothetical protein
VKGSARGQANARVDSSNHNELQLTDVQQLRLTIAHMWAKIEKTGHPPNVRNSQSWACGAAGSALPWHGRGRRFDPDQVHHIFKHLQTSLVPAW